jgi:hypothetical protein
MLLGRLCGLVVRFPGYKSRGPGSILPEVGGLERGSLSLVSTAEELLGRKSRGSSLETRDYGRRGSAALTTRHLSIPKNLTLTSPASGGHSVGIVRPRTQATELFMYALQLSCVSLKSSNYASCQRSFSALKRLKIYVRRC